MEDQEFIDFGLAKMLCTCQIYSHFLYGNFLLDGTTIGVKNKLRVAQNNALRGVLRVDYTYPSGQLYTECQVDPVEVDTKKAVCKVVYRGVYNLGPRVYQ